MPPPPPPSSPPATASALIVCLLELLLCCCARSSSFPSFIPRLQTRSMESNSNRRSAPFMATADRGLVELCTGGYVLDPYKKGCEKDLQELE